MNAFVPILSIAAALATGCAKRSVSHVDAQNAAAAFLERAGLPIPSAAPSVEPYEVVSGLQPRLEVVYPGEYRFLLLREDGPVRSFSNEGRKREAAERPAGSPRRYATLQQARLRIVRLANDLGLRPEAKLAEVKYHLHGDIGGRFKTRPYGHRFKGQGNGMSLSIDPVDGTLLGFSQRWDIEIERPRVEIAKEVAIRTAEERFRSFHRKHHNLHSGAGKPMTKIDLFYVVPNPAFDSGYDYSQRVPVARLAYVVFFGKDNVWVDAAAGKVLGGETYC